MNVRREVFVSETEIPGRWACGVCRLWRVRFLYFTRPAEQYANLIDKSMSYSPGPL